MIDLLVSLAILTAFCISAAIASGTKAAFCGGCWGCCSTWWCCKGCCWCCGGCGGCCCCTWGCWGCSSSSLLFRLSSNLDLNWSAKVLECCWGPDGGWGCCVRRWTTFCISDKNEALGASLLLIGNVREEEVTVTTEPTYPLSLSGVFSRVSSQLSAF